jgi:hypothetical protein
MQPLGRSLGPEFLFLEISRNNEGIGADTIGRH